jgi:hypothetical protein
MGKRFTVEGSHTDSYLNVNWRIMRAKSGLALSDFDHEDPSRTHFFVGFSSPREGTKDMLVKCKACADHHIVEELELGDLVITNLHNDSSHLYSIVVRASGYGQYELLAHPSYCRKLDEVKYACCRTGWNDVSNNDFSLIIDHAIKQNRGR